MTKAITLDLFAQLTSAPTYNTTVSVRSGRAWLKINTKNIAARAKALKNCHRKQAQKAVLRKYPKFTPGMSTALYVAKFAAANGVAANVLPFDLSQYTAPCALYENGALDFDVIEEQIEESAAVQEVAEVMAQEAAPEIHKPQASPAFAALIRAAREAKRIARQAIARASASSAQSVPDDADGNPYPYLRPIADTHSGGVAAAKNIRLVLKNQFPGVKFKVTSDYSSVNVRWIDGPADAVVCEALAPFDIGRSDCQTDYFYTEKTRFSDTFGGVQYLFTHRELGPDAIKASIAAVFGDNGPTYEEWKKGTPWPSVANKGMWRDSTMCDHYEWLSMVRRHADEK